MDRIKTFISEKIISEAELKAIDVHKYYLSRERGYDVGIEYAVADWLSKYSKKWREKKLKAELKEQMKEIEKHKWIESKKAGRDLGRQAVYDWINRYASEWRRWRNEQKLR